MTIYEEVKAQATRRAPRAEAILLTIDAAKRITKIAELPANNESLKSLAHEVHQMLVKGCEMFGITDDRQGA